MQPSRKHLQRVVWAALATTIVAITAAFALAKLQSTSRKTQPLPVLFPVTDFRLTNQLGRVVSLAELRGRVWLADIIFTSCAGPCPQMTRVMGEIQNALPSAAEVMLVTLTTHPEFDTPAVLQRFGERFEADPARWWFLTGAKSEIARLAYDGLKLTAIEKPPAERNDEADLFIHSTLFVLVDKAGRVRASIESLEPGAAAKTLQAIDQLLHER